MTPPLPRPDALAVRPVASHAVLPPEAVAALFGTALRGTERVEVVRLGRVVAAVPVSPGPALRLVLDASVEVDPDALASGLRLRGPVGVCNAPVPEPVAARLTLPGGTARAWGVGETAVVALGPVALSVAVETGAPGTDSAVHVDRALWIAGGRPATARWLPQTEGFAETPAEADVAAETALVVPRRVVTETDVRQARLARTRIRVAPGQIVTPAALSLAREWGVFE